MEYPYRAQAHALRLAADDPCTDLRLIGLMLETAKELEAEADRQDLENRDFDQAKGDPLLHVLAAEGYCEA